MYIPPILLDKPPLLCLYVQEIRARIANGAEPEDAGKTPTHAEMLAVLSELSLRFPLARRYAALYAALFREHFPLYDIGDTLRFDYGGQRVEAEQKIARLVLKVRATKHAR